MQTNIFQQRTFNPLGNSVHEMTELCVKTLQNFSYVTPVNLLNTHTPTELMDKHVEVFVDNGHKTLDCFHKMIRIMEKQWLNASDNLMEETKESVKKLRETSKNNIRKVVKAGEQVEKKMTSQLKAKTKPHTQAAKVKTHKLAAKTKRNIQTAKLATAPHIPAKQPALTAHKEHDINH